MTDEALEKAWELMKSPMDGNRLRDQSGKCKKCGASNTWSICGLDYANPPNSTIDWKDQEPTVAFECPFFEYTE